MDNWYISSSHSTKTPTLFHLQRGLLEEGMNSPFLLASFLSLSLTHDAFMAMLQVEKERLPGTCWAEREDYFECLHSKKEYEQVARVNEQLEINLQKEKEAAAAAAKAGVS